MQSRHDDEIVTRCELAKASVVSNQADWKIKNKNFKLNIYHRTKKLDNQKVLNQNSKPVTENDMTRKFITKILATKKKESFFFTMKVISIEMKSTKQI